MKPAGAVMLLMVRGVTPVFEMVKLRETGSLVMGARYSEVGLLVVSAENEAAARALMAGDPSIAAGTFSIEVHPFNVFYGGSLQPRARRP